MDLGFPVVRLRVFGRILQCFCGFVGLDGVHLSCCLDDSYWCRVPICLYVILIVLLGKDFVFAYGLRMGQPWLSFVGY